MRCCRRRLRGRNGGGRTTRIPTQRGAPRCPGEAGARACLVPPCAPSALPLHSSAAECPRRDFIAEGTRVRPVPSAECAGERQVVPPWPRA